MLNNRDDKYNDHNDHEESEYHFSDEDISYDVENESAESESPKTILTDQPKESMFRRLGSSKRMLLSAAVFLGLIFVVYKMVAPAPQPEISPVSAVPADTVSMAPVSASVPKATTTAIPPAIESPANPPPMPAMPQQQVVVQQPVAQAPVASAPQEPIASIQAAPQAQGTAPAPNDAQGTAVQTSVAPNGMTAPQQQVAAPTGTANVVGMPAVIPVQSAVNGNRITNVTDNSASISKLATANEQLMNQFQVDYTQKINEYSAQNKALQDQMQTLSARVATMETQLNQIVQAVAPPAQVNQSAEAPSDGTAAPAAPAVTKATTDMKIGYTVQAIIPGRAWLKADNGETVTVAEGDVIQGLGRVTKIDPYDGTVEIRIGTRTVSISYGNNDGS